MMIPINKDFEQEYKDEAIAGYTISECIWIGLVLAADVLTFCFFVFIVGLTSNLTIYLCIPVTLGIGYMGFKRHQDMTVFQLWAARRLEKERGTLLWIAGENWSEDADFLNKKLAELKAKKKEEEKKQKAEKKLLKKENKKKKNKKGATS